MVVKVGVKVVVGVEFKVRVRVQVVSASMYESVLTSW